MMVGSVPRRNAHCKPDCTKKGWGGAKCKEPWKYYRCNKMSVCVRAGVGGSSVIDLGGGGWCPTPRECQNRARKTVFIHPRIFSSKMKKKKKIKPSKPWPLYKSIIHISEHTRVKRNSYAGIDEKKKKIIIE